MCASPTSSLYTFLPRNLSSCDCTNKNEKYLGNGNTNNTIRRNYNYKQPDLNITATNLRKRVLYPQFQKIMSEIMGDEPDNKETEERGLMYEENEPGPIRMMKTSTDHDDEVTSFDEGIFINLMDDLNLEGEGPPGVASSPTKRGVAKISISGEDKEDSAASSSTETSVTSELQSPPPGIIVGGSSPTATDDPSCGDPQRRPPTATPHLSSSSSIPGVGGGYSSLLDEIVCGETPMAGICAESRCLASQSSSPGSRNIVSSVQSFFSGGPKNDRQLFDLLSPASPIYDDDEFNFPRELRKSTSLKSSKTPPGTPRRKKVVRFADVMGLDLESVVHVLNMDSPPKIPASALADLQSGIEDDRKSMGSRMLTSCFSQPSASDGFMARVCAEKISLENAVISDLTITGIIRVANIGFHKLVQVRYTTTAWLTHHDVAASYVHSSCDGPTDRFSFSIVAPHDFSVGSRLEFAISYTSGNVVYWDNNHDVNYGFECYAKTGLTEAEDAWMHFL